MLKAIFHPDFKKDYTRLPKSFRSQFEKRFILFLQNPSRPLLKDHALQGLLRWKRAFSTTGDIRVIYRYLDKTVILLLRIGTHNQVY